MSSYVPAALHKKTDELFRETANLQQLKNTKSEKISPHCEEQSYISAQQYIIVKGTVK